MRKTTLTINEFEEIVDTIVKASFQFGISHGKYETTQGEQDKAMETFRNGFITVYDQLFD